MVRSSVSERAPSIPQAIVIAIGLAVILASIVLAQSSGNCYRTSVTANKCGTDTVASWVTCNGQQCNTEEWIYQYANECKGGYSTGKMGCKNTKCDKEIITRKCDTQADPPACVYVGSTFEPIVDDYEQSDPTCPDPGN